MMVLKILSFLLTIYLTTACPDRKYGENCEFNCGYCKGSRNCNQTSGKCLYGCENGWRSDFCNTSYPRLKDPPTMKKNRDGGIVICWRRWKSSEDIGEGKPISYQVQIKENSAHEWNTVYQVSAQDWSEKNDGFEITLTNSTFPVAHLLRVVVLDESGESQTTQLPVLHIPASSITKPREPRNDYESDSNDIRNRISEWLIWLGIAAGTAFIIAVIIVIYIECCRSKEKKESPGKSSSSAMAINNVHVSEDGYENSGYVTIRMENARKNIRLAETPEKVDWSKKTKTLTPTPRSNQRVSTLYQQGRWKEALPGLRESRAITDSTSSWYTEWYDSRIYENQKEAPEELTVDQTRSMRTLPREQRHV